jgi:hypothetical protein
MRPASIASVIGSVAFTGLVAAAPVTPAQPATWTPTDWRIFASKVRWGARNGIDTLPLGKAIAKLGLTFVGATYKPATLEVPGPERLVINLRELDCVTFIENVLALVRFIRADGVAALANPVTAKARYEGYLRHWRYRDGRLAGYPSRLHYFSEWLGDNERRGRVRLITRELGGIEDREPIAFMSTHPTAYRQLADSTVLAAIVAMEARLNAHGSRWYLPEASIAEAAPRIEDGDLIAATSTVPGLDIAHTGIALWRKGKLHLLHAPLVGKSVEISALPLADRIVEIKTQDGIMVARPIEPSPPAGSAPPSAARP